MEAGPWNALEIVKLAASALTPITLVVLGIYVHRVTKRFEHRLWRSQKLVEKRLAVYDDVAPLFNDLLCYFTYVGSWRTMDPPTIVACKRALDKKVHLAKPLFSPAFFAASMAFQRVCFETYQGWGRDALLRTSPARRMQSRAADWKHEWLELFSKSHATSEEVRAAYDAVMEVFSIEIGVRDVTVTPM